MLTMYILALEKPLRASSRIRYFSAEASLGITSTVTTFSRGVSSSVAHFFLLSFSCPEDFSILLVFLLPDLHASVARYSST